MTSANKPVTILVVDDEEDIRDTIAFDLKRKGFGVETAESGQSALKIVQTKKIDLVVSDIRMPNGDGISLLDAIRKIDPSLPVLIFITGFSDVPEAECLAKGAKKVLSKPFNRQELLDTILNTLGLKDFPKAA